LPIELKAITELLNTPELPSLGPGPRASVQSEQSINAAIHEELKGSTLAGEKRQALTALLLLWHDHLDAAHVLAQELDNADGAFVHGIIHRREPDYSNAGYWFRRVGRHPAFPLIASSATSLLEAKDERELLAKLVTSAEWQPFSFISLCEQVSRSGGSSSQAGLLREIQKLETASLLEWLLQ
jgi:hypothetical protein